VSGSQTRRARSAWFWLILTLAGCHAVGDPPPPALVDRAVEERTGYTLCGAACGSEVFLPPGVSLDDGLTEDEAIRTALCNNALFQELLVDLQLANADLIQAGLLPNPEAVYFFPVSEKPYKYLVDFPLEALWLRPIRVGAAKAELGRQGDRLTQTALDLIRDVRVAYANALLTQSRQAIGNEAIQLRGRIAAIAEARLQAGDLSQLEVATARVDALQATQDMARLINDAEVAREQLRWVMGIGPLRTPLQLISPGD
jgi:cobalt-zinc-cadmium efflux system outer membrane protein